MFGICQIWTGILETLESYTEFRFGVFIQSIQSWNSQHTWDHACNWHIRGIWPAPNTKEATFNELRYMTGIYQVYTCHMLLQPALHVLAWPMLASRVFQALLAASTLYIMQIIPVSATERPYSSSNSQRSICNSAEMYYMWLISSLSWICLTYLILQSCICLTYLIPQSGICLTSWCFVTNPYICTYR